jgi:ribokinase
VLVPNQTEAALLTNGLDPESAADQLKQRGTSAVLITLGAEGVYLLDNSGSAYLSAHKVNAIDTVAAGDAFVGALAVALAEGKSLHESARWGNAAGAIAATRLGAQPSLPTRNEVLSLLEEIG